MLATIEINETQIKDLISCTDLHSRLISGQLEELMSIIDIRKDIDRDKARRLIKELKLTMFPELDVNETYGIFNPKLEDKAKTLYDIHQALRFKYSWHITPDGGFQTWFQEPFKSSTVNPLPLVTIK